MRQILANLPAIGAFRVYLHKESATLLDFFGEEELARLGRVDHLGAATIAFPGINHTRLEYVLLQCALIQLVAKLYKDNRDLALSNCVELDGVPRISSGEELLKCWALLGNIGHPNWTFATERAFLDGASQIPGVKRWLLSGAVERDLWMWAHQVLEGSDDRQSRLLLALLRLREERQRDPRKFLFRQLVRNKVLNTTSLTFTNPSAREKLNRLRLQSRYIQLLAMVTLDAYHSHSPVRLQVLPAIQELAEASSGTARLRRFLDVLEATAGWLADEVYLHPRAVAIQRAYEIRGMRKLIRRFRRHGITPDGRQQLLREVMADGFGRPKAEDLKPLVRLTFPRLPSTSLVTGHRHTRITRLNHEIAVPPNSMVCVNENPFLQTTHLDVLYNPAGLTGNQLGHTYQRLVTWLLRGIEAESLETVRRVLPPTGRTDAMRLEDARLRILRSRLKRYENHLLHVISSLVHNIIPHGWIVALEEAAAHANPFDIGWRLTDSRGREFDELMPRLSDLRAELVRLHYTARTVEIDALNAAIDLTTEPLAAAVLRPLVIRDQFGRKKDEWDGAVLEIGSEEVWLTIIEAKGGGKLGQRADIAFDQLAETRALLKARYQFSTRRIRLAGLGACLRVQLWSVSGHG